MKYSYLSLLFYSILSFIIVSSCNLINPDEQIPSYISIDKIPFKTSFAYDVNSSNITDAWVYIDNQLVGAYQLPAKFPVLFTGKHTVSIRPGVMLNGISNTRSVYPFYQRYDTTYNLPAGKVVRINPHTTYTTNTKFVWSENFENPNITMHKTSRSDTAFRLLPNADSEYYIYGDKYLGAINLTTDKPYFECITDTSYVLPYGDRPTFLEIDYKNTNSFSISVQIVTYYGLEIEEYLTVNPTATWKKMYVNLTPETNIVSNTSVIGYKIFFNHRLDTGTGSGEVLMDNIKLIIGG